MKTKIILYPFILFSMIVFADFSHAVTDECLVDCKVYFESRKCSLRKESYPILDEAAESARQNQMDKVRISGHADRLETPDGGNSLSLCRAELVKKYLVSKGVDPLRIDLKSYGSSRPIAGSQVPDGKLMNQRVEIALPARDYYVKTSQFPQINFCDEAKNEKGIKEILRAEYGKKGKMRLVKAENLEGIVFDKIDSIPRDVRECSKLEFWAPSIESVLKAEAGFKTCIKQVSDEIFKELESYKRQYVGVRKDGKKYLWVNFLDTAAIRDADWQNELIFVEGGGPQFMNLIYDPESGKCFNFSINGPM